MIGNYIKSTVTDDIEIVHAHLGYFIYPTLQISTSCGHVHILPFDAVLWSHSLPHRTQIIYPPDASVIVGGLDLVPGKRVLEAGTGSGSLTHFLAQAVWPSGRVRSFEFHVGRVDRATQEFEVSS